MDECKRLVGRVQEAERDTHAELRAAYREGDQAIEAARREFRAGYEERLQKVRWR